jgi:hypothetical protein
MIVVDFLQKFVPFPQGVQMIPEEEPHKQLDSSREL